MSQLSGWNDGALPKLWLYNLHYFDDLLADDSSSRSERQQRLIARWIAENPPQIGNGWEPYTLSRRIVNWIAWSLGGNPLPGEAVESLHLQAAALDAQLEYHLLGNHLFANAKALVFAGSFFSGPQADRWLARGLAIFDAELDEQILPDGGHFELSPMYHAIILEDMLDLLQLADIYAETLSHHARRQAWAGRSRRMLDWLATMSHPDGDIAFFNDAALGQARRLAELADYSRRFGLAAGDAETVSTHLRDSGYVRLSHGPWLCFLDAAQVGPSYIPGHAHADTLSVEISLEGERLVTNGGTSTYAPGPVRERERATISHATVEIDGLSSSEVWASFRVGRRARPLDVRVRESEHGPAAQAAHDGYRFLSGRPVHRRAVQLGALALSVGDAVQGKGEHVAVGRFPLHPSVQHVEPITNGWEIRTGRGRKVRVSVEGPVSRAVETSSYAREFGATQPRPVLTWRAEGRLPLEAKVEFAI